MVTQSLNDRETFDRKRFLLYYDLNLIWAVLVFFTIHTVTVYGFLHNFQHKLPKVVGDIFFYGKTSKEGQTSFLVKLIEVPKHWFTHFYIFASALVPITWSVAWSVYYLDQAPSK